MLPKWYPYFLDPLDGNFVENHIRSVSKFVQPWVIFVHSKKTNQRKFAIEKKDNDGIIEYRLYFKAPKTPIPILNKTISAFRYFNAQLKIYKEIERQQINFKLTHVHVLSRTAPLALYLKYRYKIPFVITEHWSGYLPQNNRYKGFLKKIISRWTVRQSSAISCVSTSLKEAMIQHGLQGNYSIIPNVVKTELFQPNEKLNGNKIHILFVGNLLQSPKRILDIVAFFCRLKEKRQDFILDIYGQGKDENEIRKMIAHHQAEDFIQLHGSKSQKEIAAVMPKSDFLFLFSQYENQPCVLNEAKSCGLPVVVPNHEGISEFMNPKLGILYANNNLEAFENAILQMMEHFNDYNPAVIRAFAKEHFSEEIIENLFNELYQKYKLK